VLIAGNWKMYKGPAETDAFCRAFSAPDGVEVVVCPPFTALRTVQLVVEDEYLPIGLGAQNLFWEDDGAYTGEISGAFLKALHCTYVIVGHSERRKYFGETDETVNKRTHAAIRHELKPIVCVGETEEEHDAGQTEAVVERQVREGLKDLTNDQLASLVIAYEPVWAIGTGKASTAEDANETISHIRKTLGAISTDAIAQGVRIEYGGSVSPGNIAQFMAQPEIDGALVGAASLDPEDFALIVKH
jgi:triosephosphate isomerase